MLEKATRSYFKWSMNVETASLIFAMIKCIIFSFATLICVFAELIFITTRENLLSAIALIALCLVSIPCYYSLLLARGIMTKNSEYVKNYFTYGITSSIYLMVIAIVLKIFNEERVNYGDFNKFVYEEFGFVSLVCTLTVAAYIPILILIRYTYLKIERQSQFRKLYAQNLVLESPQILKKPDV